MQANSQVPNSSANIIVIDSRCLCTIFVGYKRTLP